MKYEIEKKKKSEVELTVTFDHSELEAKLQAGAQKISDLMEVKGFRKGKAPYEIVVKEVGEMKVYEHAAEILVSKSYTEILTKEKIEPLTQPQIEFVKLAPNNEFVYKATITTIPSVEIGDISSISVKDVHIDIKPEEIEKVVNDLREYSTADVLVERPAKMDDKVEMDFDVFLDNVLIEGGQGKKYPLVLGKGQMIPGFEENVVGMNKDEEKEFKLTFPKEYQAPHLADKECVFKIKLLSVFERQLPEANDSLAKLHGAENLEDLKHKIKHSLEHEETTKQNQRLELEIIEELIKKSKFGEIPDALVNQEIDRMVSELKNNIMRQGLVFEDYLGHLKKDEASLRLDFAGQGLERVKAALLTRAIFIQKNLVVSEEELNAEVERLKTMYKDNANVLKTVSSASYKENMRNVMANSSVMRYLKETVKLG